MSKKEKLNWAIIGAGNGGQAVAGYLGLTNHNVKLYDIYQETVDTVNSQGGIYLEGEVQGFGKIEKATTNLQECLEDADIAMVITPSLSHHAIAKECAPFLKNHQIIVLHPGATFGSLAFKKALEDFNCKANVTIAESNTLIYACRAIKTGTVFIAGIKNKLLVSSIPAKRVEKVVSMLNLAFPQVQPVPNTLFTSLDNTNPMVHPGPTLLSASLVESNKDWLYYRDGITPTISKFIEEMDKERIAIGKALGLQLISLREQYAIEYNVVEDNLYDVFQNTKAYDGIKGSHTLHTRYLLEDIPMGLVPLVSVGKLLNVPVERMETVINLAQLMLNQDLTQEGRTLENLGLANMNIDEMIQFMETGEKN